MSLLDPQTAVALPSLGNLDEPAILDLVRKEADLIDIRFTDEFKVCTYRLDETLIEIRQNRRHLEELAVSIIGTELR